MNSTATPSSALLPSVFVFSVPSACPLLSARMRAMMTPIRAARSSAGPERLFGSSAEPVQRVRRPPASARECPPSTSSSIGISSLPTCLERRDGGFSGRAHSPLRFWSSSWTAPCGDPSTVEFVPPSCCSIGAHRPARYIPCR
ncbi:hypothetical protein TYRP_016909 [Tyrophagus putrescentiae]|nr:hypothetical protein TYRP_016909 [Tyrophagus putrescentiae]